ncbi:uncharacterized protein LOC114520085 [Dendronephthya gigantea]|uniref:uncharacterized protein LOC114520085 n=1 Tax=Dendronephthya gigantea TaxID=151771 RepID=UPI00106A294E|nr:uncharacterized protein LOC114520085 [Dendronephthya gigantea]
MDSLGIKILLVLCWIWICPVAVVDITDIDDYDPGTCDSSNALQIYSVNDRNDRKKLWVCSPEKGVYVWKPVDGVEFYGEYLYPGNDCSDILDHEPDAEEGFYWITLGGPNKRRVWCDMKTDGGGFMLVARKHAIAWDIPSKDEPVHPLSDELFWTSQLGDAPILDFRIQLSTSKHFNGTKAHWSYRFNKSRTLGNLLITTDGCDTLNPGIGDIAYVKDLQTGKIVTTTFACSVFGSAKSDTIYKSGWPMMNECLKKPCKGSGYLHIPGIPAIQNDHTGVFSFSTTDSTSGINNDATAYVGCLLNSCCGCYGPVGGTANYCTPQCTVINGGTKIDAKNVFTWVWVRTSLPKHIWKRCMEYQKKDDSGQLQWYNLIGDSTIPEKGRCPNSEKLRLNTGIVVLPDGADAGKVPAIPGMLEYRLDSKKLYVRANKTWSPLTQEKEVKGRLLQLEKRTDERYMELKEEINSTDTDLNRKIDYELAEIEKKLRFFFGSTYKVCTQYKWLNESDRRYNYLGGSNKCDNTIVKAWYRFGGGAGSQMYTSCRSFGYCSAGAPGYLSGSHPTFGEGIVSRTVYFANGRYSCYSYSDTIRVINCGSYYVYELVPPSGGCNLRYCSY